MQQLLKKETRKPLTAIKEKGQNNGSCFWPQDDLKLTRSDLKEVITMYHNLQDGN
jgi:hypothetical protein